MPRSVRPRSSLTWLVVFALAGSIGFVTAQAPSPAPLPPTPPPAVDVRATYTKYEHLVPMRDGVRLFTQVYVPKDDSQAYPVLLNRTPYSVAPYGADVYRTSLGPSDQLARDGYIFVYQDVRGRVMSEGEFVNMRPHNPAKRGPADIDESTDTWDTIDWIVKHVPNNNGRVGMWGVSYPGFYAAAGMIDAHPALKAVSPQAPIADWFAGDDFHHNGALFLPHAFNFFVAFGQPRAPGSTASPPRFDHGTPDGYRFFLDLGAMPNAEARHMKGQVAFWTEMMQHEKYDAFWQARNLRPHLRSIAPAVMTVGGWFDAENLFGALNVYRFTEQQSPGARNSIVMGPWYHGGWSRSDGSSLGDVTFGSKTAEFYRERIELPFFSAHLKGRGEASLPEAYVFETGTNVWRRHETWPPRDLAQRALYFHENGRLAFDPPADAGDAFDEFVSDPARPVPYIANIAIGMTREYMVDDQRFASRRPDVLVYRTDVLAEDVTVAGPVLPRLTVSTTGTDADWVVKLIDVYPDTYPDPEPNPKGLRMGGFEQLVRGDVMRGRFRNSLEAPEPFTPGEPTNVAFTLNDVYHTFRRGHRIMVHVQSTWFPLVNRNPQTFVDINTASASDYQKATHRVYRSARAPSHVVVGAEKGFGR
jgi:putative CocE/NonD family hydrolase